MKQSTLTAEVAGLCIRCLECPAAGFCCSAHGKQLCHLCYRRTHFVEVCSTRCTECAAEGLPVKLVSR